MLQPMRFENKTLFALDQTRLPGEISWLELKDHHGVAWAIRNLGIRGAPAIGIAAAYGIALGAEELTCAGMTDFLGQLERMIHILTSTRPTARNLFQAAEHMRFVASSSHSPAEARRRLTEEALQLHKNQKEQDTAIGCYGAELVPAGSCILTHCNTGPLATGGYGTAFGVINTAHQQNKNINVIATETRPLLQGARLTAFELQQAGIPFQLITDSMAGFFMQQDQVNLVITGADRISANGDTANKIGTYSLAVLARHHGLPFYIAAPLTTFDFDTKRGADIVIENREQEEVTCFRGVVSAPEGTKALNPAFDVTPAELITALITDKGVFQPSQIHKLQTVNH